MIQVWEEEGRTYKYLQKWERVGGIQGTSMSMIFTYLIQVLVGHPCGDV